MFVAVDVFQGRVFGGKILKSVQCFRVIERGKVKGWLLEFFVVFGFSSSSSSSPPSPLPSPSLPNPTVRNEPLLRGKAHHQTIVWDTQQPLRGRS